MSNRQTTDRDWREEAVHAITGRNRLLQQIDTAQHKLNAIEERLAAAEQRLDEREAAKLRRVRQEQEDALHEMQRDAAQCAERIEDFKALRRDLEAELRRITEEVMRERDEWKRNPFPGGLPDFEPRMEQNALRGFLAASLLLTVAAVIMALWLR